MAKYWTIHPDGINGRGPQSQLISCKIAQLSDEDGVHYALFGPNGTWRALQDAASPVQFPIQFPKFNAQLNGGPERDWYIEISSIDILTGAMSGTWGNSGYKKRPDHEVNPADTDTWTAQASSGGAGTDQEETVAAAASSRQ